MKILVTGGAGYIGSAVVEQLIAAGESVIVFDNLSLGHRAAVHPAAVFVKGDLSNRAEIDGALSDHRPDAVMHFASKIAGWRVDGETVFISRRQCHERPESVREYGRARSETDHPILHGESV